MKSKARSCPPLVFASVLLLSALSMPAQPEPTRFRRLNSGVEGEVTIGPLCPVVGPGHPCPTNEAPYQTTITVLSRNGREMGEIITDTAGQFQLKMPPGTYVLVPAVPQTDPPGGITFPYAEPVVVTVKAKESTQVSIRYFSGIR